MQKAVLRFFLFSPLLLLIVAFFSGPVLARAQSPSRDRIIQEINPVSTVAVSGTVSPLARPDFDMGRADPSTQLTGITMYFRPSAAQQAALQNLLKQQQTPGSPLYHQWITPAQYAAEFGLSANDLAKVKSWLEQQGFSIDRVANSGNAISFSGTIAQVEAAFQTEIHHYSVRGVTHTANASPLSIPSALAGVVLSVRNISDFRPHPLHRVRRAAVSPQFTFGGGSTHFHFLAPGDFATIYDLNPLYSAGDNGSGKTIVIVGQSAIVASDITHFQSAAGLTQKAPTAILVPGTGTSTLEDKIGDEDESDLDLEWSAAVARGATIDFVYTGSNRNFGAFDSIQYAVDNKLGSIISSSYGTCEADLSSSDVTTLQSWFEQANMQGQTIIAASGDNGATDCESISNPTTIVNGDEATLGLAVDIPAASPSVTGIGGTEFLADVSSAGSYWNSSNSAGNVSAIQYIPEKVWDDTSTANGIESGGGGKSALFGKPTWQKGTGVPSDGARDVPDISLNASPNHDGYLICASGSDADPSSCSHGFLDSSGNPNVAGGTSFGAPTFAGILAILLQKLGSSGLGDINPEIYSLASSDYSSAFHDTTSGSNKTPCVIGKTGCTASPIGYSATTGYDLASGWGSIDGANFVNAFTASSPASHLATTTSLTASNSAPVVNSAVTITATVTSDSGSATPAGTVQFAVDGAKAGSAVALSSSGIATISYTPTTAGSHTILGNYTPSNTATSAASAGTITIMVYASTSGSGSLGITATNVTVAQGSSGMSTVAISGIPSGFTGAVALSVTAPAALTNACFTYVNPNVSSSGTTGGSVTVNTSESACTTTGSNRTLAINSHNPPRHSGEASVPLTQAISGVALASFVLIGIPGFRRRRWTGMCAVLFVAAMALVASGCGSSGGTPSSNSSTTTSTSPKGVYTLMLTGTNQAANLSATTTFTLTVN
ncbi:MAG TPA: protease pro-enzyme activation domain-containing protein [Silvibacterium sp.]|nr:protease pro-enzyme activation domain-containing protein [Silvibacterium sp.]